MNSVFVNPGMVAIVSIIFFLNYLSTRYNMFLLHKILILGYLRDRNAAAHSVDSDIF